MCVVLFRYGVVCMNVLFSGLGVRVVWNLLTAHAGSLLLLLLLYSLLLYNHDYYDYHYYCSITIIIITTISTRRPVLTRDLDFECFGLWPTPELRR